MEIFVNEECELVTCSLYAYKGQVIKYGHPGPGGISREGQKFSQSHKIGRKFFMAPSPNTCTGHFVGNYDLLLETGKKLAKLFFALTFKMYRFLA